MRVRKHQGERVMVVPEPINTVFSSIHTHTEANMHYTCTYMQIYTRL